MCLLHFPFTIKTRSQCSLFSPQATLESIGFGSPVDKVAVKLQALSSNRQLWIISESRQHWLLSSKKVASLQCKICWVSLSKTLIQVFLACRRLSRPTKAFGELCKTKNYFALKSPTQNYYMPIVSPLFLMNLPLRLFGDVTILNNGSEWCERGERWFCGSWIKTTAFKQLGLCLHKWARPA